LLSVTGCDLSWRKRKHLGLRDVDGLLVAFPEGIFYGTMHVGPGSIVTRTLIFDLYSFREPAKIRFDLPDGVSVSRFLQPIGMMRNARFRYQG